MDPSGLVFFKSWWWDGVIWCDSYLGRTHSTQDMECDFYLGFFFQFKKKSCCDLLKGCIAYRMGGRGGGYTV